RVYDAMSTELKSGSLFTLDDVRTMTEHLVETRAVQVKVVQLLAPDPSQPAPDVSGALEWIEREIVDKLCQPCLPLDRKPAHASLGTLGDMFGVGTSYGWKNITQIERASADVDFSQRAVVVRTLTQAAHLADLLGGAPPGNFISDVGQDNPFFKTVPLRVTVARPLQSTFVSEVDAVFSYGSTQVAMRLDGATPEGRAVAYADASADRTWRLPFDVKFTDDAPFDHATQHVDTVS